MPKGRSLFAVLILTLAAAGCKQAAPAPGAGGAGAFAVPVTMAKAVKESVPLELNAVGTVEASAVVQVKSLVAGQLLSAAFTEGQNVKEGDLLFRIDARPYEDALKQAQAAAARDRALIAQSEAQLARDQAQSAFAATDAARNSDLAKEGLASRSQSDQSRANADVARESAKATQAGIDSARAALQSDEAAISEAQLNIGYCQIHAPISGRAGNLLVHPGNLVKVNDVALVVIHRMEPVFVSFSAPEDRLGDIRRLNNSSRLRVEATPRDETPRTAIGYLSVIDNTVDSATGTIRLKATFENTDGVLWPGQFVAVKLSLGALQDATVIPSEAVQAGQNGSYVYAVKADGTAEIRPVTPGAALGGRSVIEKGLAPGETVVTDGILLLAPGMKVRALAGGAAEAKSK